MDRSWWTRLPGGQRLMKPGLTIILVILLSIVGCKGDKEDVEETPNAPPTAHIDSIVPEHIIVDDVMAFKGHGTDADGVVVAFRWTSDIDGFLSGGTEFETSSLSQGEHTISFEVQDGDGVWSEAEVRTVTVRSLAPLPVIEFFTTNIRRIGLSDNAQLSWYVSGATSISIDNGVGSVSAIGGQTVFPDISTDYTLSATNEAGTVTSKVSIVVVPVLTGAPAINMFQADPGNITLGNSATLRWNVSKASAVRIDPGIGVVDPVGSVSIAPIEPTSYVISAGSGSSLVVATTQILVTSVPTSGHPDLVVTDVRQFKGSDGVKIQYTIQNQGENIAPTSNTRLYAHGTFQAADTIGELAVGESITRLVDTWTYNPATNIVRIIADADHNVVESDELNNEQQVYFPVESMYDFIENAIGAEWGGGYPYESLTFGEGVLVEDGYAVYVDDERLEDLSGPRRVLETVPRQLFAGWIIGDYDIDYEVQSGDHFYGVVGIIEGATLGNVEFWVYVRLEGQETWDPIVAGVEDRYDSQLTIISAPIPPEYFGAKVDFSLRVSANGDPLQDEAVWVQAEIIR